MGRLLFVVMLVGCTHAGTTTPAWPKAAVADKDGGESIAPHESKAIAVAIEKPSDDAKPEVKPDAKPAAIVPTDSGTTSAATPAITQSIDETLTTEDIIIEIDD